MKYTIAYRMLDDYGNVIITDAYDKYERPEIEGEEPDRVKTAWYMAHEFLIKRLSVLNGIRVINIFPTFLPPRPEWCVYRTCFCGACHTCDPACKNYVDPIEGCPYYQWLYAEDYNYPEEVGEGH